MTMGVKVYYSEISGSKEVKKRQQHVMMILDSRKIPYKAIDITEAGMESDKDFMIKNAKPRGDSKYVLSPQLFNDEVYCGDYEDFELANENDELESFLQTPKVERSFSIGSVSVNGTQEKNEPKNEIVEPVSAQNPPPQENTDEKIIIEEKLNHIEKMQDSPDEGIDAQIEPEDLLDKDD